MAYHMQFANQKEYERFHERLEKIKKLYIEKTNDAQETFDTLVKKMNYSPRRAAELVEQWRSKAKLLKRRKPLCFQDFICQ